MKEPGSFPGLFSVSKPFLTVEAGGVAQQELLHLQVTATFFVTFLIIICCLLSELLINTEKSVPDKY